MFEWIKDNQWFVWTLTGVSVAMFVGTLIALPIVAARIPADYFSHERRHAARFPNVTPLLRTAIIVAKNVLGYIILLAGVAMLVLPGQGLLAMLVGTLLIDFPGKYRFERWLVTKRVVRRAINWLRRKSGQPPLQVA